ARGRPRGPQLARAVHLGASPPDSGARPGNGGGRGGALRRGARSPRRGAASAGGGADRAGRAAPGRLQSLRSLAAGHSGHRARGRGQRRGAGRAPDRARRCLALAADLPARHNGLRHRGTASVACGAAPPGGAGGSGV
ncbi:MAG: Lipopolysaccharide export system permease protein LptF, partial [uncultured Rubellimicrobium sp.]